MITARPDRSLQVPLPEVRSAAPTPEARSGVFVRDAGDGGTNATSSR
jgi:hypothetical protein